MRTRKKVLIGLGIIVLTAVIYGYQEYTRTNEDLNYVKANFNIQAVDFIKEFEENEKNANEKFLDKIIAVSGTIREMIKDDKGYYSVVLGAEDNMSAVRCSMNAVPDDDTAVLRKGNIIVIKGSCTGFNADELLGSDIILARCVIQRND